MTKGRIAKYVANTALLAVLAAAGIGVYQLGTSGKDESVPEKVPSYYDESLSTENTTDNAVDAGTSLVEAELESNISTDHTSEKGMSQTEGEDAGSETTEAGSSSTESTFTSESILSAEQSTNENGTVNTSASVQEAPKFILMRMVQYIYKDIRCIFFINTDTIKIKYNQEKKHVFYQHI